MRALLVLPVLVLLAACDSVAVFPPDGAVAAQGISLTADRASYDNDDEPTLTLRNDGPAAGEMGVLGCVLLERQTEAGWAVSPDGNDRACIAMLITIPPGETMTASVPLGVPDGTYRYTHVVSGATVATASFEVR